MTEGGWKVEGGGLQAEQAERMRSKVEVEVEVIYVGDQTGYPSNQKPLSCSLLMVLRCSV